MGIRAIVRRALHARSGLSEGPEGQRVVAAPQGVGRFRAFLRDLDERHPEWRRYLGGRLDIEIPAILVSISVHVGLLLALASASYAVHNQIKTEFSSRVVDTNLSSELQNIPFQDIDMSADPPSQVPQAGTFAPKLGPSIISAPPMAAASSPTTSPNGAGAPMKLAKMDVRQATAAVMPTAQMLGQTVSIKGNGVEHAGGVEGAVDRLADEILRRLEKGRTLVIWMFDASGSLVAERERLSKHIDTVYTHITQLDQNSLSGDGGLLTSVVSFGHDRKAMTPEPTADKEAIVSAINSVPLDTTGVETTFQTVAEVVRKWGKYKDAKGNVYHPMVIVVTDEVGDDENHLEEAIEVANRAKVPVYVLGSQALFGRVMGFMNYTDPKTKQTYYNLPVRQGPESAEVEMIRIPFWYDGPQYEILDSGFGPYALSRLAGATGGIYFVTRLGGSRLGFDAAMMREYKPDWVSKERYLADIKSNRLREAVVLAGQYTQQKLPAMPALTFPPADAPEFKEAMRENQALADRTVYTVDEALKPITMVAKLRDRETSKRWQAHYDLIRGRLLAMKIRCYEYNWACASMKKDAPKFKNANSNAWKLVPDDQIRYSDKAAAAAKEAKRLLERLVADHPGTPWALMAQRELKDAFGFKWVETYVKPIPKGPEGDAAKKKKTPPKNMPKPPDPPKL